jgi:hypothetical protein
MEEKQNSHHFERVTTEDNQWPVGNKGVKRGSCTSGNETQMFQVFTASAGSIFGVNYICRLPNVSAIP